MALFAEGILKTHWDQTVPVNLAHIAKGMGVVVRLQTQLPYAALLEIRTDHQACIHLAQTDASMRQRCAAAHALGHVALHHLRPGMQRAIHLAPDCRVDHRLPYNTEANDFALRLLMPEPALRFAVHSMQPRSVQELEHLFDVPALLVKQRMADLNVVLAPRLAQQLAPELAWD